jgi:transcriptional regulator with XRE-family HTH domain
VFHDVKQNELAERLGISKSFLSEIESGKKAVSVELIEKYSVEFQIPASSILFFSENLNSPDAIGRVADRAKGVIARKVLNFLQLIEDRTGAVEENT